MMTITIESFEHALEYYSDDTGHGLTYCNVKIGPWNKGPNQSEIQCDECKAKVAAEDRKRTIAAAGSDTILTEGSVGAIAKVLLTNNDIYTIYERRGVTRREVELICALAQEQIVRPAVAPKKRRSIEINEDDGSCPKCGQERNGYKGLFHHPDGGDEEASVACASCGEKFTILRRVIVAEYSVKEKS